MDLNHSHAWSETENLVRGKGLIKGTEIPELVRTTIEASGPSFKASRCEIEEKKMMICCSHGRGASGSVDKHVS